EEAGTLNAKFYRFLDGTGAVLSPLNPKDVGNLRGSAEGQSTLKKLPEMKQIGYLSESGDVGGETVDEVMVVPIFSTETGDVISALVVGFQPFELARQRVGAGIKSGIWLNGRLYLPALSKSAQADLGGEITNVVTKSDRTQSNFAVSVNGAPYLLFYGRLNPDSLFPPAYEICIYPLANFMSRLHRLGWQIGGAGALLLLGGFVASNFVAARLSAPVEKLAEDSETNRAQRKRAEAALASTSEELERSARYSADASHQLKTPVTILRAGLEALLTREDFNPEVYHELSVLLHQTHRLTGVIDDLLLLSRIDAGHLQIESEPINLSQIVEEWLDDLGALPDSLDVKIEKKFPAELYVAGEKRYISLIVQNLLENSRKYNRPGGRICVAGHKNTDKIVLNIGNTGCPITGDEQEHIFERFHRGSSGTAASRNGLGLNLARELARFQGGDLRLVGSDGDWTEFEVCFRVAQQPPSRAAEIV